MSSAQDEKRSENAPNIVDDAKKRVAMMRTNYIASTLAPEPEEGGKTDEPRCGICKHPRREGIETLAITSLGNWAETTRTINRNFGTNFEDKSVKRHMTAHRISAQVRRVGLALSDVQGDDPLLTAHGIVKVMLAQALSDVAAGRIRAKNVSQVMQLVNMDAKLSGDIDGDAADISAERQEMYRQISVIADILRSTLPPDQLESVMRSAGDYNLKLAEVPAIVEDADPMALAVEDMRTLGRRRTRAELIEAGLFDEDLSERVGDQE